MTRMTITDQWRRDFRIIRLLGDKLEDEVMADIERAKAVMRYAELRERLREINPTMERSLRMADV